VGSNPSGDKDICLLSIVRCQVEVSALADHSPRGVLPNVVFLSVIVKPRRRKNLVHWGLLLHGEINVYSSHFLYVRLKCVIFGVFCPVRDKLNFDCRIQTSIP